MDLVDLDGPCGPPPTYLQVQIGKMKRNLKEQWNQDGKHYHHPKNLQVQKSKTTKSAKFTEAIPPLSDNSHCTFHDKVGSRFSALRSIQQTPLSLAPILR